MRQQPKRIFVACCLALAARSVPAATDHHLHIMSPALAALTQRLNELDPVAAKLLDPEVTRPHDAADVLAKLDAAGVQRGVLLSGAYIFSSPMLAAEKLDVPALTRAENAYNVAAARGSGGRLVAFIGLNPLDPGALDELDRKSTRLNSSH